MPASSLSNRAIRQIIHVSKGGTQLQLKLSNVHSKEPVDIKSVFIADAKEASDIDAKTAKYVTFNGKRNITIEPGKDIEESHMRNRKFISEWCYEKGAADNVIEKKVRDGKTYFVVNDYVKLRGLFAELLAEIQRIKSEGDYAAGKALVETYAVHIDPALHKEVKERYDALGLKPYGGFINPEIRPVQKDGKVVDYEIIYPDDYLGQMLEYGRKYGTL